MENRLKRLEIGILFLILLNVLIISLLFAQKKKDSIEIENEVVKELPKEFDEEVRDRVVADIKDDYNSNNYDELYNLLSEWAQLQIPKETVEIEFSKLSKVTGNIIDNAYSYYDYTGFDSGADWYDVYYKMKFENGIGTMKINLRVIDATWEITGLKITLDEL